MIDLHCHVLAGIDDGPETLEGSVALARAAAAQGTRTIVATPHVNTRFQNRADAIAAAVGALNARLAEERVAVEVRPGAEIAMTSLSDLGREQLAALALGGDGGRWLLIESPFTLAIDPFLAAVRGLQDTGHGVVLAHPERCAGFQHRPELVEGLVRDGALVSITAGSLVGDFGREPRKLALALVGHGLVHNVASDAHDAQQRPPSLAAPIRQAGIEPQLGWLTDAVPAAILAGEDLPRRESATATAPEPSEPGGWRRLLRRR